MAPRTKLHPTSAGRNVVSRMEGNDTSSRVDATTSDENDKGDDHATTTTTTTTTITTIIPRNGTIDRMAPTTSLPILVFIDMFAVSLVVPLLFQYYKKAGVTSANQRELLSSVFSSSQIVGGILLGAMTDAHLVKRRTVLFLSFGGSALAYAMIAFGGFQALIVSRILVGLVKQTMTVTTSILTKFTNEDNRAKHMGVLQSSATASWIVGPSVGAVLFKYVDHRAPALLASALFLINMVLAAIFMHDGLEEEAAVADGRLARNNETMDKTNKKTKKSDFLTNLRSCFSSPALGSVIAATLIFYWFNRTTSYASMGSYYEDMYGMEPHQRGYIQSYQQVLGFVIQSSLVGPILSSMGGERRAVCLSALLLAMATFLEMQHSLYLFLIVLSPAISVSTTMMNVSLRSLLTSVAPDESIFSVFAALDVLQNATAVTVPFYRTFLFRILGGNAGDHHATMQGDPDPVSWVVASALHWLIATLAMVCLLRPDKPHTFGSARCKEPISKRL